MKIKPIKRDFETIKVELLLSEELQWKFFTVEFSFQEHRLHIGELKEFYNRSILAPQRV